MTLDDMMMGSRVECLNGQDKVNSALTKDQCWHGFGNTATAIRLWLMRCDKEGRKLLLAALAKDDKELDALGR